MALTVVKYRKSTGDTTSATPVPVFLKSRTTLQQTQNLQKFPQIIKKPIIKLEGTSGLVINKIPAIIKPAIKRSNTTNEVTPLLKSAKCNLQTVASAGTPSTSFQWQQTIGGPGGTTITTTSKKSATQFQQNNNLAKTLSSLPPNTIIQATSGNSIKYNVNSKTNGVTITPAINALQSAQVASSGEQFSNSIVNNNITKLRPTLLIKSKRSIRSVTIELIEKNPLVHLGVSAEHFGALKNIIAQSIDMPNMEYYLVLKKLRQNEEFSLLAQYFDLSETEAQQMFVRGVVRLARYFRFLICWPDNKRYYDRHKNLPFAFRTNLSHIQSLIECVETEMLCPLQIDCTTFKFILSIMPNGVISYVSEVYVGHHDDLSIFSSANFVHIIPKYLSMAVEPGKAIRRTQKPAKQTLLRNNKNLETDSTTDSAEESVDDENDETDDGRSISRYAAIRVAGEFASHQTLKIKNNELVSTKTKDIKVPTVRVREPMCRLQIRHILDTLREFKILQPCAIQEPILYQFLNEILIVCAALVNLQH